MSKSIEVQSPDLGYINFVLSYEDEQGSPASKTFRLVYTYRAIRLAEESLGIDLKDFSKWAEVKSSMTPKLVLAGLAALVGSVGHPCVRAPGAAFRHPLGGL